MRKATAVKHWGQRAPPLWPSASGDCAQTAEARSSNPSDSRSAPSPLGFLSVKIHSFHNHRAVHARFPMAGDETGIFERSALGEFPEDRARCERQQP
jgi:hypothetical protein